MAYDVYALLGDVGGALGLLLGYSIFSIYDAVKDFIQGKARMAFKNRGLNVLKKK